VLAQDTRRSKGSAIRPDLCALALGAACLALLAFAAGCAASRPEVEGEAGEVSYSTDEQPLSSIGLIDAAQAAGALDYSTALLYKVYVMFEPESLPPEYRSDVPSKCGTPVIMEVQRNWHLIAPDDRLEISKYIQPPGEPGSTRTGLDDVTPDRLEHERDGLD
jgi:hypothetical protein